MSTVDLSTKTLGFLGCGKISSAVCRGFASCDSKLRPAAILVSRRSEEKSAALASDHPELVRVCDSNEEISENADIVFIGLLPAVANAVLPTLKFKDGSLIISMMAAVDYAHVLELVRVDPERVARTVPLPSCARREGPILCHPSRPDIEAVLSAVGTPVVCKEEAEMKPLVAITGHISPFYELLRVVEDWSVRNGVAQEAAHKFIGSFYSSMSSGAELSPDSFGELCHEAATPGGLNEQAIGRLRGTDHFQVFDQSLTEILARLTGKK